MANYEQDTYAWAYEQAALLKAGRFSELDIEHLVEEIESVGNSEKKELKNRMIILISHFLKWQFQPGKRGNSWVRTIRTQRREILLHLKENPSLKQKLTDTEWIYNTWLSAVDKAEDETGLINLPMSSLWDFNEILEEGWLPK